MFQMWWQLGSNPCLSGPPFASPYLGRKGSIITEATDSPVTDNVPTSNDEEMLCQTLDYGALDLGELAQSQTIKLEGELRGSPHPSPHGQWNYP